MDSQTIQINKFSQLVSVSSDVTLRELKRSLSDEGFFFGYAPLDLDHFTLHYYLSKRTPNLYHFRYGSLADLTSSLGVQTPNKKQFHLKDAPRSAIGPDFNRVVIGSRDQTGVITNVTLKITPLPERIACMVVPVPSIKEAKAIVTHLIGNFTPPLLFRHCDDDSSKDLIKELKIKSQCHQCLILFFSGIKEIVHASLDVLQNHLTHKGLSRHGLETTKATLLSEKFIHSEESCKTIREQYRSFLWPASDASGQLQWEQDFLPRKTASADNTRKLTSQKQLRVEE